MHVPQQLSQPFVHLVGAAAFASGVTAWPSAETWTRRDQRWTTHHEGGEGCGLWRISSYGQSALRQDAPGRLSLSVSQLQGGAPLPANNYLGLQPQYCWLEVQSNNRGSYSAWRINPGQTCYVYGTDVSVGWWAPPDVVDLGVGARPQTIPLSVETEGGVVESLLFVEIAAVNPDISCDTGNVRLTETYLASGDFAVRVPLGARTVQVQRDNVITTASAIVSRCWATDIGNPLLSVGSFPIVNNSSAVVDVGGHPHLQLPPLVDPTLWTLDWRIQTG